MFLKICLCIYLSLVPIFRVIRRILTQSGARNCEYMQHGTGKVLSVRAREDVTTTMGLWIP